MKTRIAFVMVSATIFIFACTDLFAQYDEYFKDGGWVLQGVKRIQQPRSAQITALDTSIKELTIKPTPIPILSLDQNGDNIIDSTDEAIISSLFGITTAKFHGADCNGDGKINVQDIAGLSNAYDTVVGDMRYRPGLDFNSDGKIDSGDIAPFSAMYGLNLEKLAKADLNFDGIINAADVDVLLTPGRTAQEDIATRLRIWSGEINILSVQYDGPLAPPAISEYNPHVFKVEVERLRSSPITIYGAGNQITPQPYGLYTYTIEANLSLSVRGATNWQIKGVQYSNGSYDEYQYIFDELSQTNKLNFIIQYDENGNLKSRVSYEVWPVRELSTPELPNEDILSDRVQTVKIYDSDGTVSYTDFYRYSDAGELRSVARSAGDQQTLVGFLAFTSYAGAAYQERAQITDFGTGTSITYQNDLAQAVYQKTIDRGIICIMSFNYDYDRETGAILQTHVVNNDGGDETIYQGLPDPIDLVFQRISGQLSYGEQSELWQKQAVEAKSLAIFNDKAAYNIVGDIATQYSSLQPTNK